MQDLISEILEQENEIIKQVSKEHYGYFCLLMNKRLEFEPFHIVYYKILHLFAIGEIKKLIISMPPQHGKSEGSTRLLVPYILGLNPNLRIAIGSYASTKAQKFNREIQRNLDTEIYNIIFPGTLLNNSKTMNVSGQWLCNSHEFEVVGKLGGLKAVGRGGGITGDPVDVWILDDVYKDLSEGNSPVIRDAAWDWFDGSVQTRTHNDTQELIVFTRWHKDDIIGRLEEGGEVIEVNSWEELKNADKDKYIKINFEAIKESDPTEFDPRELGEVLWEKKHGINLLNKKRKRDTLTFDCLYQGNPETKEGLLYGSGFRIYEEMPRAILSKGNCTDTADEGDDYLASVTYNKVRYKFPDDEKERTYLFVTDVLYTKDPMEVTEKALALMLDREGTRIANIESNNGGRAFARNVRRFIKGITKVVWYHQSHNKESRILTNATSVMDRIVFPVGWDKRFPEVHKVLSLYKKIFKANKHDDLPDVLTAIIEKEIVVKKGSGIRRAN